MVRTTSDVLDINPLERMEKLEEITSEKRASLSSKKKEFEELEEAKRREIADLDSQKRKEFEELEKKKQDELDSIEQKRKEFSELEATKIKEIEETQELIEKSFQELMLHKRILMQEDEEKRIQSSKEMTLEEVTAAAPKLSSDVQNMNYGKFFENMRPPQTLYEVTNNTFYNGLTDLRNRAASGQITTDEERFVQQLRSQFEQFNSNEMYLEQDTNQYIRRSMGIIEQIDKYQRRMD